MNNEFNNHENMNNESSNNQQENPQQVGFRRGPGRGILIIVVLIAILIVGGTITIYKNNSKKISNIQIENNTNEEDVKDNNSSKEISSFHVIDYDYASLKEGGDGSNVQIVRNSMTISKFYDPEDLPDEFFNDNPDIVEEMNTAEFEEINSRFLYPFASDYEHYYIYNLDNKSSVLEAFNKGWYALGNFYLDNMDVEFSFFDGIAVFDASITGLGKPECVIKSQYESFPGELEEGASGVGAFVIYKLKSYYLFLDYNEYINSKEHNMDLMDAYLVFSPEMVQAMIKDNAGSNSLDRYTQEYIYKNRCSFELKK